MPSTQRSSVTSLDSTAGMHRLPPLLEDLPDNGVAEEGSAALVDAWLTSLKVNNRAKEAIDSLTTSLDALSVDPAKGDFGTVLGLFGLLGPVERIIGGMLPQCVCCEIEFDTSMIEEHQSYVCAFNGCGLHAVM